MLASPLSLSSSQSKRFAVGNEHPLQRLTTHGVRQEQEEALYMFLVKAFDQLCFEDEQTLTSQREVC